MEQIKPVTLLNRVAIAAVVFVLMAGYLLWSEHRPHVLGALPYLLLLACPLMHVFMHHGHHHGPHHGHGNAGGDPSAPAGRVPGDTAQGGKS